MRYDEWEDPAILQETLRLNLCCWENLLNVYLQGATMILDR